MYRFWHQLDSWLCPSLAMWTCYLISWSFSFFRLLSITGEIKLLWGLNRLIHVKNLACIFHFLMFIPVVSGFGKPPFDDITQFCGSRTRVDLIGEDLLHSSPTLSTEVTRQFLAGRWAVQGRCMGVCWGLAPSGVTCLAYGRDDWKAGTIDQSSYMWCLWQVLSEYSDFLCGGSGPPNRVLSKRTRELMAS